MKIDYNIYYKNNLMIPIVLLLALIIFMIVDIRMLLKNIATKSRYYYIFSIFVSVIIILCVSIPLHRGICLITEKEQDALIIEGEITDIEWIYNSPRYYLNGKACRAVWVCIGVQKYYIVDTNDISIGDEVQLTYRPRSRFIMEYNKD